MIGVGPVIKYFPRSDGSLNTIPIGAHTATVYSRAIDFSTMSYFAIGLKCAGTTVNLKISLEQSYRLPVTEGAADDYYAVPNGVSAIIDGLADNNQFFKTLSPITLRYGRLKIETKTGNTADTVLTAILSYQED